MTDTERERIKAICEIAGVSDIEDLSDGFHTFRQLYYQRMMLFAVIVKQNKDKAWKSLRHEDGELCFGGEWFIVGVDTPEGNYTYHYEANYYSLFDCKELERGKHWDGHTEKDVTRLLSLPSAQPEITDEQAIDHLLSTGWMQNHDREMYDMGLKKQLADDSGSYDSLLPFAQPERKKGKLISLDDFRGKYNTCGYKCSECGEHSEYEETSAQTAEVITEVNRMSKDVVYRQAAIEALHEWENLCEWDSWINEHQEQTGSVSPSNVIEQLPSAQPEPQWIPCSERLPDKEDIYLCCSAAQDIWILRYMMPYYFKEGAFIQFDGDYPEEFSDVIAWMPLPEPYKGGETE